MIKDVILLGSTGSVGISTLNVIKKNKKSFNIKLLTTNNNIKKLYDQALEFKVKKVVIYDQRKLYKFIKFFKSKKIKIYSSISEALKNNKKKVYITVSAISGIDGLEPTLEVIKYTKNLSICNKESIICGWKL